MHRCSCIFFRSPTGGFSSSFSLSVSLSLPESSFATATAVVAKGVKSAELLPESPLPMSGANALAGTGTSHVMAAGSALPVSGWLSCGWAALWTMTTLESLCSGLLGAGCLNSPCKQRFLGQQPPV